MGLLEEESGDPLVVLLVLGAVIDIVIQPAHRCCCGCSGCCCGDASSGGAKGKIDRWKVRRKMGQKDKTRIGRLG